MERTATHLLSSPNPAQLEMRILANHGADGRFAFLKGRWSRAWKITKTRVRADIEKEKSKNSTVGSALGGLAGYGGSDDDTTSDHSDKSNSNDQEKQVSKQDHASSMVKDEPNDEDVKQARRARAREWAEKRRANALLERDSSA